MCVMYRARLLYAMSVVCRGSLICGLSAAMIPLPMSTQILSEGKKVLHMREMTLSPSSRVLIKTFSILFVALSTGEGSRILDPDPLLKEKTQPN